ncbi:hypothetical protein CCACVL1_00013 [Corchorus capsularis]|uniref:Uncharacterized protein n=1 Tax=Corchorus capsularis TaxID=210143 RepID=A0A1R3KZE3_COCAP|nr:hypothetical protein CCACVL1_00013 [Corchorus capsularis]
MGMQDEEVPNSNLAFDDDAAYVGRNDERLLHQG